MKTIFLIDYRKIGHMWLSHQLLPDISEKYNFYLRFYRSDFFLNFDITFFYEDSKRQEKN